jgi:bifunctional UDP-N-acetylglucosamine pyrophosphorylase / glucosamine-1-phosphate N-acetyltransferase
MKGMKAAKQKPVRAIVLAGGQGKRMKSALPKVLHEVLGQPILARLLRALDKLDLEHIHIVIGHQADQIRAFVPTLSLHTPVSLHLQEPQAGTGHAVMQVEPGLAGFEGTLLVVPSDAPLLSGATLVSLISIHEAEKADVTLLTTIVEDPKSYGRIVRNEDGTVQAIVEHKDANREQRKIREIGSSIYCFRYPLIRSGLSALTKNNQQGEYYLTDLIGWANGRGHRVFSVEAPDWREVVGINSRMELSEASRLMRDLYVQKLSAEEGVTIVDPASTWISPEVKIGQDTIVLPGCWLVGNITIGPNCLVGPHTVMQGEVQVGSGSEVVQSRLTDCQVGNKCKVGPYAHLRPGTVVSDNAKIGNFVELKKSFVGLNTNVSHLSYVGDATVGNNANIGAGTIIANYDHITGEKKRTTIGNGAATGSNSVLVAPVTLGDESVVGAGTVVTKDVPAGSLSVRRVSQENIDGWVDKRKRRRARQPVSIE